MKKKKNILLLSIILIVLNLSCKNISEDDFNKINELKLKYDKFELKKYAEEDYNALEKKITELKEAFDAKNNSKKNKISKEINKQYLIILKKALPACSSEKNELIKKEIESANEIKANVAAKQEYEEAKNMYDDAIKFNDEKKYENAIDLFIQAEQKFKDIYQKVKVKKEKANTALDELEKKIKDFENLNK